MPPYVQQATGATLLARGEDWDWALVRLVAPPPAGDLSSRRGGPSPLAGECHRLGAAPSDGRPPEIRRGDVAGVSEGFKRRLELHRGAPTRRARPRRSLGAALITFNTTGGYYEVRGGLFGGEASCSNPAGADLYSRFDKMLPLTRQYLTPGNNPSGTVVAVEFYNPVAAALLHLDVTPGEINDLDTGVHVGWERTGLRLPYLLGKPGRGDEPGMPVLPRACVRRLAFLSASPSECAATAAA